MDVSSLIKDVKEEGGFVCLPAGQYDVAVGDVELKQSSTGGKYLNFKLIVLSGEHKGHMIFDLINIFVPSSDQATNIGLARLKRISNLLNITDINFMKGRMLTVDVVVKHDKNYGDRNNIKFYVDAVHSDTSAHVPQVNTSPAKNFTANDLPF